MTVRDILKISELGKHVSIDVYSITPKTQLGVQNGYYIIPEKYLDYEIQKIKIGSIIFIYIDVPEAEIMEFDLYDKKNTIEGGRQNV